MRLFRTPDTSDLRIILLPSRQAKPKSPTRSAPIKEYGLRLNEAITPSSAGVLMAIYDNLFTREGMIVRLLRGNNDGGNSAAAADQNVIGLASSGGVPKGPR